MRMKRNWESECLLSHALHLTFLVCIQQVILNVLRSATTLPLFSPGCVFCVCMIRISFIDLAGSEWACDMGNPDPHLFFLCVCVCVMRISCIDLAGSEQASDMGDPDLHLVFFLCVCV